MCLLKSWRALLRYAMKKQTKENMSQKDRNFGNICERDKMKLLKDINKDSRPCNESSCFDSGRQG